MMRIRCLPGLALLAAVASPARAQCPDGTPPPCASAHSSPSPNSVAVLYFDNLSRDTADAYLADGLTEEIIVRLGQVPRLSVKSRYETQRVRGRSREDVASLGRVLNSAYLVSGSVQRSASRVRVRVELARARDRSRLWGDVFDRTSSDVLQIEEEIARAVVERVAGQLLPAERTALERRPTRDAVAYDLYLRGNYLADRFTEPDLRAAIAVYEQAIARDSTFMLAYRGLAYAWSFLADDFLAPRDAYPQAERAIEHALAIDSSAAVLGWTLPILTLDFDVVQAERRARRAIELAPDLPDANWGMMWVGWAQGRMVEAAAFARRAFERDTLSFPGAALYALALASARLYDELAALAARRPASTPPEEIRGWEGIAMVGRGDCAAAVPAVRAAHQVFTRYYLVPALVCAGRRTEAEAALDSLLAERRARYLPASTMVFAYAALGEPDQAFAWLERAIDERDAGLVLLRAGPAFDGLRADPRFETVLRRTFLAGNPDR